MAVYRIVSRDSRLALLQVTEALAALSQSPATALHSWEPYSLPAFGDKDHSISLLDGQAPTDLFTREIDTELRAGRADCAVHSAKDLPIPLPPDIQLYALLPQKDPRDALVCRVPEVWTLETLPQGARVGTSSPLRRAELLALRPDLQILGIRGTIEERIAQTDAGAYDAVIVAQCALERLDLGERVSQILPFATHPLQGRLAVTGLRNRSDLKRIWSAVDERRNWGRIYLVGAGAGDPELLTLKAIRLLKEADIIFNDSLANPRILEGLRAEIHFVGKRKDTHGILQAQINEKLYQAALTGKAIVRLKGGDPMLFGRASEEMDYLEQRLVDIELVPGISSALAASSYTQIPLTERDTSASVAFCLGHPPERIPVPDADTLVYFMASASLAEIIKKNLEKGKPATLPVALIYNASMPDQRIWISTLGQLSQELAQQPDHPYKSPLLVMIGTVIRKDRLANWYEQLPRVWYTGTSIDNFRQHTRMLHYPLITISPLEDSRILDTHIKQLQSYEWVVFTSRYTVEHIFSRIAALNLDTRAFAGCKIAAVGKATAKELAQHGLRADLVPELESSIGLVARFTKDHVLKKGTRVFLPCSDKALPVIFDGLSALGAEVARVETYRNVAITEPPEISLELLDEVILTSPSTAKAFASFFPIVPDRLILRPMGDQTRLALEKLFPGKKLGDSILDE